MELIFPALAVLGFFSFLGVVMFIEVFWLGPALLDKRYHSSGYRRAHGLPADLPPQFSSSRNTALIVLLSFVLLLFLSAAIAFEDTAARFFWENIQAGVRQVGPSGRRGTGIMVLVGWLAIYAAKFIPPARFLGLLLEYSFCHKRSLCWIAWVIVGAIFYSLYGTAMYLQSINILASFHWPGMEPNTLILTRIIFHGVFWAFSLLILDDSKIMRSQ